MNDLFVYTASSDPRARPLIEELTYEYESRYGKEEDDLPEMDRYSPEVFEPPHGSFLLLLRDGVAIGGGAFMRYDEQTAELKRIWTRRTLRRQGVARKVLTELEAQCARQGYLRAYLTTGSRQPEAIGLYLGMGYRPLFDQPIAPDATADLPFVKVLAAEITAQECSVSASKGRAAADDAERARGEAQQ